MMTEEDRVAVVAYRMENARRTLDEVIFHIKQGFYNTAMNRICLLYTSPSPRD